MKIHYALLLCCLFVAAFPSTGLGERTLHTFTTPDGRTLNAVIKGYNARTGKIQIERKDGKEVWILPTAFSEPDQEYIQQWIVADQFMSPTKFKIEGDSDKNTTSKHTTQHSRKTKLEDKTEIVYELSLENKMDFSLKDLKIEYRAFILNKSHEDQQEDSSRVGGGHLIIAEIPAGGETSQKLLPITLFTQFKIASDGYSNATLYDRKIGQEYLEGFWIKVYGPEVDGKPAIREWCYPSDTRKDFTWQEETAPPSLRPRDTHEYSDKETELLSQAGSFISNKNYEKALEVYQECYEIAQAPRAAWGIGYIHLDIHHQRKEGDRNIPLGLEWMEKAAAGNNYSACEQLAFFYIHHYGQYYNPEKALQYGLQAIAIDPEFVKSHQRLADAYARTGQFDKAIEHLEIGLELTDNAFTKSSLKKSLKLYQNKKTR